MTAGATVCRLSLSPVKGARIHTVERIDLESGGVEGNRRFYIVDARGHMVNGKRLAGLTEVVASLPGDGRLRLEFPARRPVEAPVADGETVAVRFFSQPRADPLVLGPFSDALSEHLGETVRLVRATDPAGAVDRGARGAISIISRASLRAFAARAGRDAVDGRRFRMLVELDGVPAHEEDRWVGRELTLGTARVAVHGHVGRCLVTSRHPETGQVDLPTLDILASYRGDAGGTEPLPVGVYGEVLEPGRVGVGDIATPMPRGADPQSHGG